jgi:pimeloyl-ACP methyl ester carboxylesterase
MIKCNPDVACIGTGSTTIVALHGIQGTRASWLPLANVLSTEARWILPNLQGRGEAWRGLTTDDYSLEAFAQEAMRAIDQNVGTGEYVLAGWSMGVSVILAILARLQETGSPMPQAIILMSGSPVLQQTSWFQRDQAGLLEEITLREQRLSLREAADHDAVALTWQAIRHSDQRSLLPSIIQPTLVLHGSEDQDAPLSHAEMLVKQLPQARLYVIEGAGHSILTQNTDRVAEQLRAFLSPAVVFKS